MKFWTLLDHFIKRSTVHNFAVFMFERPTWDSNPEWTLFKSSTWSNRYWKTWRSKNNFPFRPLSCSLTECLRWKKNCTYCKVVKSRYATSIVFCHDLLWSSLDETFVGQSLVMTKKGEAFIGQLKVEKLRKANNWANFFEEMTKMKNVLWLSHL